MTWPREGSRETDEGIIISEPMDWCRSPTAIVPYKIYAYQREATNLADSVRQTDDRTHVKDSVILKSYGDEPGVGGGVRSGTRNAECTPKTWSESVRAEGRNVVRHDDEWWMNHKNTWGRLVYLKDQSETSDSSVPQIKASMSRDSASLFEATYKSSDTGASAAGTTNSSNQTAQEGPIEIPPGLDELIRPVPEGLEPIPYPGAPDPIPAPEEAPSGGGRMPRAPGNETDDGTKDPRQGKAPKSDKDPEEEDGRRPPRPPPGFRASRCRTKLICFDSGKYDLDEYLRQLKMQQNAINRKSACKNVADIQKFDDKSSAQKDAYRASGSIAKNKTIANYKAANPGKSTANLNALHELDMVAGGDPNQFGGMGDAGTNKSIGSAWNQDSRKNDLKSYAQDMCANNCKMAAILSVCSRYLQA